jgi:SNF2 family DNA or RNA helicase
VVRSFTKGTSRQPLATLRTLTTVYRLVVQGSIEERIMSLHRDKRALAEGLFSGEAFGQALSVEELAGLLRDAC